jgi:redox-sensitive bicupin YhaK (pirin superfamily)
LQIWIQPNVIGIEPGYEQKTIPELEKRGHLRLVASPDGENGSVSIHADALLYAGLFDGTEQAELVLNSERKAYVFLMRGSLLVNDQQLTSGDALLVEQESLLTFADGQDAEVLVFDLAR